jgi:tRNA(Ile)-lysidine synthase TilS/MesJ
MSFSGSIHRASRSTEKEMKKKKTLLSWSSGKDSAWALHLLQHDPKIELLGLFTVIERQRGQPLKL